MLPAVSGFSEQSRAFSKDAPWINNVNLNASRVRAVQYLFNRNFEVGLHREGEPARWEEIY